MKLQTASDLLNCNYRQRSYYIFINVFYLNVNAFYRATLCVSAVFAVAGVRLSVTFVYCSQTAEDIVKLLSPPGSPMILVFFGPKRRYPIPRGTPSVGAQNTRGEKILRFSTEIAVYIYVGLKETN